MVTMNEIRNHVIPNNCGRQMRELPDWYWSNGICFAYDDEPDTWKPFIKKAMEQVFADNYGGFYNYDEKPIKGSEYYLCESPFGKDINNGIIIHREHGTLAMYFQFER